MNITAIAPKPPETPVIAASAGPLALYRAMLRIRLIEEEIANRYSAQEMRCPVHLSIGQEATAVGACAALRTDDQIVSSHRSHGTYLAKGGDLNAMMAEIYGRETGCCGGRGGSMHLFDDRVGVLASVPIVGSFIALGTGAALSFRHANQDRVCIVFLGDGAIEEGIFHESANFAALKKLPVIFFIENNGYSCYTNLEDRQPVRPLADVARAHGMPSVQIDGNDVMAVYAATSPAVARARAGLGPTLIVADTYRWREHCGPSFDNHIGYRTEAEYLAWKERDPIATFELRLRAAGIFDQQRHDRFVQQQAVEIASAFTAAKSAPFPASSTLMDHVYA